jgi:hypothetical protein
LLIGAEYELFRDIYIIVQLKQFFIAGFKKRPYKNVVVCFCFHKIVEV